MSVRANNALHDLTAGLYAKFTRNIKIMGREEGRLIFTTIVKRPNAIQGKENSSHKILIF